MKARDVHCRFPGCRRPAVHGELDHIHAWADGGHTSATKALPDGGLEWTTPTGRSYVTQPHDYRGDPAPP